MTVELLGPGVNPRDVFAGHRERGRVDFGYHVAEIAAAAGLSEATVRKSAEIVRAARARDVGAVSRLVLANLVRRARPLDPATVFAGDDLGMWAERWPRLEAYNCVGAGASHLALGGPLCGMHGGGWSLTPHFTMRSGRGVWQALHRIMLGCPQGAEVHHKDHNPWNNRPENLVALSMREHRLIHERARALGEGWRAIVAQAA